MVTVYIIDRNRPCMKGSCYPEEELWFHIWEQKLDFSALLLVLFLVLYQPGCISVFSIQTGVSSIPWVVLSAVYGRRAQNSRSYLPYFSSRKLGCFCACEAGVNSLTTFDTLWNTMEEKGYKPGTTWVVFPRPSFKVVTFESAGQSILWQTKPSLPTSKHPSLHKARISSFQWAYKDYFSDPHLLISMICMTPKKGQQAFFRYI